MGRVRAAIREGDRKHLQIMGPSPFNYAQPIRDFAAKGSYPADMKFWVDIGTLEGQMEQGREEGSAVRNTRLLIEEFGRAGLTARKNYIYLEVEGGRHNEDAWAKRADRMLLFFFGR